MEVSSTEFDKIIRENEALRAQKEELEEVLRAIRAGEVDAIVGPPDMGGQVFTLKSAETPYRHFVENMNQGAAILDHDLTLLYCNRKFAEMAQEEINTLIGTGICKLMAPADADACLMLKNLPVDEKFTKEIVFGQKDKRQIPARLSIGMLECSGNRSTYSLILTDLSLIKKNEAIIEAENFTRSVFENIGEAVFVCDTDYTVTRANYEAYRLCSCIPLGRHFGEIMPLIRTTGNEERFRLPEISDDSSSEPWTEVILRRRDSAEKNLLVHSSVLRDPAGAVIGYVIDIRDITEIHRYESALNNANKKLNLLSQITRHDILNQVSVLLISLDMALESGENPDELRSNIRRCFDSANTISRIISFTHNYQELGVKAPLWQNIAEIADEVSMSPEFADLKITADTRGLEVLADPMIVNVFRNFFDNAVRHGKASAVRITCRKEEEMIITVEDDGRGIPPEVKGHIFERGFGYHTGFGLFLAREILDMTGCTISETGEEGNGACFEIHVPHGNYRFPEMKDN